MTSEFVHKPTTATGQIEFIALLRLTAREQSTMISDREVFQSSVRIL
jgi:hypothetical protein